MTCAACQGRCRLSAGLSHTPAPLGLLCGSGSEISDSSTPIREHTTPIGSGCAKSVFRSTTEPSAPFSPRSSRSSPVSRSMTGRSASSRRGAIAWLIFVRSRRCSAPSTVNMERPASIMPINGHSRVTTPDCHRFHCVWSFTKRVSVSSCRARLCRVTVQAGAPSSSILVSAGPSVRVRVSPARSATIGSIGRAALCGHCWLTSHLQRREQG